VDGQALADDGAAARHDVEDSGRQDVCDDAAHLQDGERRVLRALEHQRVAGGQCGRGLEARDHERGVPREDARDDAHGLTARVLQLVVAGGEDDALRLAGDAAHVAEEVDERGGFRTRLRAQRVAGVQRGQLREVLDVLLERVRRPEQEALTLLEVQAGPRGEGLLRCLDGTIRIRVLAARDRRDDDVPVDGGDDIRGVAVERIDPLTADEHRIVLLLREPCHAASSMIVRVTVRH
jgi:hypothetical protein